MAMPPDREIILPGAFLQAVRQGEVERIAGWLSGGYDKINYQEAGTGLTALHYAAARNALPIVRLLVATGKCNMNLREAQGRTAARLAVEVADNPVLGRYLYELQYRDIPERQPDEDDLQRAR